MSFSLPQLGLFLRKPTLYKGKTRLAKDLGAVRTLIFYREMLDRLIRNLSSDAQWQLGFSYADPLQQGTPYLLRRKVFSHQQPEGDLGQRMADYFIQRKKEKNYLSHGLIGSDCPFILKNDLSRCFHKLEHHHIVLAPSYDGGFWFIGIHRSLQDPNFISRLFQNIRWSHSQTLQDFIDNAQSLKPHIKIYTRLPLYRDIDTIQDYCFYMKTKKKPFYGG